MIEIQSNPHELVGCEAMRCHDMIDAGGAGARGELLFLVSLIKLVGGIESLPNISGATGFTDVYRCPKCSSDDYIALNKPSEDLLKTLASLRAKALELVGNKTNTLGTQLGRPA